MALLVFKVVAMAGIVAACVTLLCLLFLPLAQRVAPQRRRAVAWRMAAFLALAPLALMVVQGHLLGERRGYWGALFWLAPAPAGYLLGLAVLTLRERRTRAR